MQTYLKRIGIVVAVLAVLITASASYTGVFAQEATVTPAATARSRAADDMESDDRDEKSGDMHGEGKGHGMGGFEGRRGEGPHGGKVVDAQALADFLGISGEQLGTELHSGLSLSAIAESHGTSRAELKTFLIEQFTTMLDAMIDAVPGADLDADDITAPAPDASPTGITS
jgi:hypothetical protein